MRYVELDDLRSILNNAINGRRCIEVWLGYAQVLFIGFGEDATAEKKIVAQTQEKVLYQLQADYADWFIERIGVVITADDAENNPSFAEIAARQLVGHKATGWRFLEPNPSLEIDFDEGWRLRITPILGHEEELIHKVAWVIRIPDHDYIHVRWDGIIYSLRGDEPVNNRPD